MEYCNDCIGDRSWFEKRWPISKELGSFFRKVLNPIVGGRLTLEEMERELMSIEYF